MAKKKSHSKNRSGSRNPASSKPKDRKNTPITPASPDGKGTGPDTGSKDGEPSGQIRTEAPRPRTVAGQVIDDTPIRDEDSTYREDNLEMKGMSHRERRAIKKERIQKELEGKTRMEKVSYLLYYYKTPLILTAGAVIIITLLAVSIIINKRPVGLSAAFINVPSDREVTEDVFNDYLAHTGLNYDTSVKLNAQARLDLDTADEVYRNDPYDYSLTQFPVLCSSDFFDVVITDKTGLDFCSYSNIIFDPEIIISPDTVLALRDHEAKAKDSAGTEYFYAYDITDTKFAKSLNFGTRLYLCFPGRADGNKENAERFLRYLYRLENKTE